MSHHNTVFSQILKMLPRHEFSMLADKHDGQRRSDAMNRWTQFIAMATAQFTGRSSLRDIESTLFFYVQKAKTPWSRWSL